MSAVPSSRPGPPLWLLAELTYRCPLHCVFCYNPVDFAAQETELSTDDWLRVLRQGRKMGAVQEGVLRKSFLKNGEYLDQTLWTILEEDWCAQVVWSSKEATTIH